jgi:5-oxoprolinase (ATP-hydrolysing)
MGKGDRLRIETPGGGGWGLPGEHDGVQSDGLGDVKRWAARGSLAEREAAQAGF